MGILMSKFLSGSISTKQKTAVAGGVAVSEKGKKKRRGKPESANRSVADTGASVSFGPTLEDWFPEVDDVDAALNECWTFWNKVEQFRLLLFVPLIFVNLRFLVLVFFLQVVQLVSVMFREEGVDTSVVNAFNNAHTFFSLFIKKTPLVN